MLHVHRSASGRRLSAALADVLRDPGADPFTPLTVAVPARGVERWLAQRLSHTLGAEDGDGVCANVDFPSPASLLDDAVAGVSPELAAAVAVWRQEAMAWLLVELLDALPHDEPFEAIRAFLCGGTRRRYALAAKVARLLHSYGDDRPELLTAWVRGEGTCPPDLAWQPALFRRLRDRLGPHPAELHADAVAALRGTTGPALTLYGLTRITRSRLEVLAALAEQRDVHLFVHHPGAALWDRTVVPEHDRRDTAAPLPVTNPLLAGLSRDVRELQQRLLRAVPTLKTHLHDDPPTDTTLLQRLQRDLRTDVVSDLGALDPSVQVHACHGPARQVEVLRDLVLGLLQADPTLEPRDILVLCPDVEKYAPLVMAAFGSSAHPAHRLQVQVADRSPRQTNPLLGLAARLLTLAGSRVTATEVLDLAGSPAVRERFGLTDDDLEQLRMWVVDTHVHWGLDGEHRAVWGLNGLEDGTWRRGLDRLLASAALGGDEPWQGVLRHDGLDSADLDLLGRVAELLARVEHALHAFRACATATQWLDALEQAVGELGAAPVDAPWQTEHLRRVLAAMRQDAGQAPAELADVVALLGDVLVGRPTGTSFRTGALTVCTLTPMRSVPHRVVVLLGMDDGAFPRHGLTDGDDVLAREPRLGERDPRSEDRQLFLDAVLAAEQHLVVLYTGAHVRTGAVLPAAVPVGELLDLLPDGVVVRHPLQPFDARSFDAAHPFSFDPVAHAGAVAAQGALREPHGFLSGPVAAPQESEVALSRVVDMLLHPSRAFLRQRLDVTSAGRDEQPSSELSLELDGLEQWGVGDRLLQARLAGGTRASLSAAERARGALPPGRLGDALLDELGPCVYRLAQAAAPHLTGDPETVDVDLALPSGRLLGAVPRVHGRSVVSVTYSKLGPRQRLRTWVELLAVSATRPGPYRAVLLGRAKDGTPALEQYQAPDDPKALLASLVALRAAGMRTPLALPHEAAAAYAQARREGDSVENARDAAAKKWKSPFSFDGPDRDQDHCLLWGHEAPFSELWGWRSPVPLPPADQGEPTDFARLACAVWYPLLDAEVK